MHKLNCRGVGLVIDDKALDEKTDDPICVIVSQLTDDGIPLLRYRELPTEIQFENLHGLAFVLVDWSLLSSDAGAAAKAVMEDRICDFITKFHTECFAPVFVFSNQDENEIKQALKKRKIEVDSPNAYVLVRSKSEMQELDAQKVPKLFAEINKWICATPTIRLLTTWGYDLTVARDKMFVDFYQKSHNWPMLLWNAYKEDGDDPTHGLNDIMFGNLRARMQGDLLLEEIAPTKLEASDVEAVVDVLGLTVMLPSHALPCGQVGCGDLFEIAPKEGEDEQFELVVSCDCDCIVRDGESANSKIIQLVTVDKPILPGNPKMRNQRYDKEYGLAHKAAENYLFPIKGKCFRVWYRGISTKPLSELKIEKRIGRILPPFITDVRQRVALWHQRVGLPKLPNAIFKGVN